MKKTKGVATSGILQKTKRIVIIDDHPVVCLGLKKLVEAETDFEVVGVAGDGKKALKLIVQENPDVATIDIAMPGMSGLDLIRHIRVMAPDTRIIVVSMYDEETYAVRAIQAGASGYVMKEEAASRLVDGVRAVAQGELFYSTELKELVIKAMIEGRKNVGLAPDAVLSARELEVFESLGRGETTREIAEKLLVSVKTVETYRSRIRNKLNLKTTGDLIKRSIQWMQQKML